MRTLNVIDLGNGDFKVASNIKPNIRSFPAVFGQFSSKPTYKMSDRTKEIDSMSFVKDNREYAIGNNAIKNCKVRNHDITEDKYVSESTILLSNAALAMMANDTFSTANLILALPVHKMGAAESIIRLFKGHTFGGRIGFFGNYEPISKVVMVEEVIVIEQPWGTLFKLILNESGEIIKEMAKKSIAIFDIGFKTNDGIVFRNLDILGRLTINSKNGMYVAFQEIQDKISQKFSGLEVKIFEVPEIVRTGEVRGVRIPNIINEAMYNLAYNIILEIKSKWQDAWEIDQYVFTGGGAELLKPYLAQAFESAIFENSNSNAEGFLRYAKKIWGRNQ